MRKQIVRSGLILACALLTTAAYMPAADQPANSSPASASQQQTAVVFRFGVQGESMTDTPALASQACSEYNSGAISSAAAAPNNFIVEPNILDAISADLQKGLSKKMSVMVDPDPKTIPAGSVIVSGCIFKAQKGNKAERMVGFGLGASKLGAHVVLLSKTETGFASVDSFDLEVKGRAILPPAGPAGVGIHAAKELRETLSVDAKKLADRIVKRMNSDMKQQLVVANASLAQ